MKAIVTDGYAEPERLRLSDLPVPTPGPGQVLVQVHHTTINDYDWSLVRGRPYPYRLLFGWRKPAYPVPGIELSGTVAGTGPGVDGLPEGTLVFGDISHGGWGSWAEYVVVSAGDLRVRPPDVSSTTAAALPHAGQLAWQALFGEGQLTEGGHVLINGAGGGVGAVALQLAKSHGATVTGVDSASKLASMRELGFDRVIDYRVDDFTRLEQTYDLIVDAKTTRSAFAYARVLRPGGRYVTVGGHLTRLLALPMQKVFTDRSMHIVALRPNRDLDALLNRCRAGQLQPVVDGPYALADVPRLLRYFGEGRHHGKIVIEVSTPAL